MELRGVVVVDVELAEGEEVSKLGRDVASKLVAEEGEVLEVLPGAVLRKDLAEEEVVAEVKVAKKEHGGDGERNFQIHSHEDRI